MAESTGVECKVCRTGELIYNIYEDYHCNVCGVRYKFLPAVTLSRPLSDDSKVQIQPGLFVARESTAVFKKDR